MPSDFVAHSSPKNELDKPPHLYSDHVHEVEKQGMEYAQQMFCYSGLSDKETATLHASLRLALRIHDIGKLEPGNQEILSGRSSGRLPYDHVDGGVAVALSKQDVLAAWLIRAHHAPGLASATKERLLRKRLLPTTLLRGCRHYRDDYSTDRIEKHKQFIEKSDGLRDELIRKHEKSCNYELAENCTETPKDALTTRLLLSCLVDADHSDTARYYAKNHKEEPIVPALTRWDERLKKLEHYISGLTGENAERKTLRDELFNQCQTYSSQAGILTCSAPVGLGKTTAVMANILKCADDNGLRRIFVIAPYTNIITQTADKLRQTLVLEGENPNEIVAEHHHRVEFASSEMRQYASLWKAPIVVTTAVQFFETLASASPSSVRKLHELPGSAIFVDECHACVPSTLMRQTWYWIKQLASCWSCHFVLASGSLVKFWESADIVGEESKTTVPSLLSDDFFYRAQSAEQHRVKFCTVNDGSAITETELLNILSEQATGCSKLIILNTVQSAAVIAKALQPPEESNDSLDLSDRSVLHLSTALTPHDRERIIDELKARQSESNGWKNRNWYLVATSCVEAGIDLDFDFGYRERCSVTSFLQTAGRVNREGLNDASAVYDFMLQESNKIVQHPAFKDSIKVFEKYWDKMLRSDCSLDELSTHALIAEIRRRESSDRFVSELLKREQCCDFQQVQEQFKIINSNTVTVVVDPSLQNRLSKGVPINYREIQKHSVQIWSNKIEKYCLEPCGFGRDIYYWGWGYDSNVLGYMKNLDMITKTGGIVV